MRNNRAALTVILALLLALSATEAQSLSAQESGAPPRKALTVLTDDNYPPYVFRSPSGELQGIIPDQWELWSQVTGIPVRLEGADWGVAQARMKAGEADVLETAFITEERRRIWDFSEPYADIRVPVYVSGKVSGIAGPGSLEGFLVGVKEGDACIEQLRAAGVTELKLYPGYEEIVRDAAMGNIHVFCVDEPPALYYIHKLGVENEVKEAFTLGSGKFHRAVRKGNADTLALLRSGFSGIDAARYAEIDAKWMGKKLADSRAARTLRTVVLIALAGALALVALILYLRALVRRRNAELAGAVARLEESEARATALLEANPDLLFTLDEKGVILHVKTSPSMPLLASPESFLGKNIKESVPPALAARTLAAIDRIIGGETGEVMEYVLEISGKPHSYEARLFLMGEKRVLAVIRDITERKGLEEERVRSQKLESISAFAGGIAHDFNNILTAIEGNIALAKACPGAGDACAGYLSNAEKAADRAGALTSQLLAFAKGGAAARSGIPLSAVVREAATFALSGTNCALNADLGDDPFYALADRDQLAQVVRNLVANASQAMPGGGSVGIRMTLERLKGGNRLGLPGGSYVAFTVSDSGPGIPEEHRHRLFDPYFTTKPGASGLGLSICHSIIKHHGGAIELASGTDAGAAFTVYVPAARADYGAEERSSPRVSSEAFRGTRALVMDDEESIRDFLGELLKEMEIPYETAAKGEEGLELFEAAAKEGKPFGLIFADLTIAGGMGGAEMMAAMRRGGGGFKSVVISGYATDPVMASYRDYGFDARLTKPFKIAEFKNVVELLAGSS